MIIINNISKLKSKNFSNIYKGHFAELEEIVRSVGACQKFIFSATLTLTHKGSTRLKNMEPETSDEKLKKLMKTIGKY